MGCKIKRNRHGYLAFRLIEQGIPGGRSWEGIGLKDTPENRRLAEAKAVLIDAEMKTGSFDYLRWFPHGNRAGYFDQEKITSRPRTILERYEQWIAGKAPPLVRKSTVRDWRQHFECYILPRYQNQSVDDLRTADVIAFRSYLIQDLDLKVKTAKNVIGSLKAFYRDAIAEGIIAKVFNPFEDLPERWWPTVDNEDPDPFNETERDRILDYFKIKRPILRPFIYFLFWQGCRPSEATALKWRRVDLARARASITESRNLGAEAGPKTRASRRTITLLPNVVQVLKTIKPLRVDPNSHVFLDSKGKPIDQAEFGRYYFQGALRALEIRHRDFYNTRDTFVSIALSKGIVAKWISEQTGTSLTMIGRRYGRWLPDVSASPIDILTSKQSETQSETFDKTRSQIAVNQWVSSWSQRESNPFPRSSQHKAKHSLSLEDSSEIPPVSQASPDPIKYKKKGGLKR